MTQLPIFLTIFLFMQFYLPHSSSSEDTRCPRPQTCTERTSCPWYKQKWEELKALDRRSDAYRNLREILKAKVCNKMERKVCCCTGALGSCSISDESEQDSGRGSLLIRGESELDSGRGRLLFRGESEQDSGRGSLLFRGEYEQDSGRGSVLNSGDPFRSWLDPDFVEGETRCCPKKVVAGNSTVAGVYILEGEFPGKVHVDCKDNCIYSKDGKDFCFGKLQPTDYTVQCLAIIEDTSEDGLVLISPYWTYFCEFFYDCFAPQIGCTHCKNYSCYYWRNKCCYFLQPICAHPKYPLPPVNFNCQAHC